MLHCLSVVLLNFSASLEVTVHAYICVHRGKIFPHYSGSRPPIKYFMGVLITLSPIRSTSGEHYSLANFVAPHNTEGDTLNR